MMISKNKIILFNTSYMGWVEKKNKQQTGNYESKEKTTNLNENVKNNVVDVKNFAKSKRSCENSTQQHSSTEEIPQIHPFGNMATKSLKEN